MREMKNSGIPWIGDIPNNWQVRKFITLGSFSASGIDKLIVPNEPLVRIINYVDVYNNGDYELREKDYMTVSAPEEKIKEHQVIVGDMILTPSSETIDDIGVASVVMEDLPNTAYSYHVIRFRSNKELFLSYKKYICNNRFVNQFFSSRCNGTIRKTVSRNVFKECPIIVPPIPEQQVIADFLDKKCAEIDEMISLQEKIIEELKAYKQSVITEAVTKGLNPDAPMKDSGVEWIGEIPEHWGIQRLKFLCDIETGNKDTQDSIENGEYPFYVRSPKVEHSNSWTFDGEGILMAGDGAGAGRVFHHVYGKYAVHQRVYRLSRFSIFNTSFIFYYISTLFGGIMDMGSAQSTVPSVRLPMLQNFIVCLPPNKEQNNISIFLNRKCSEIDSLISLKQSKIEQLKEYKKSIIYEYVTGKKEVEA